MVSHRSPSIWHHLLKEPLIHFLLLGALLYGVSSKLKSDRYTIELGPDTVARIVATFRQQYGSAPDQQQSQALLDSYIREEVYLREGLALGLDRNDEIVRRRIAQKFEFLQDDRSVPSEPREQELKTWFETHRSSYQTPAKRSLEHRYFAIDARGEAGAYAAAQGALDKLRAGQQQSGDEFPGPVRVRSVSGDELGRMFGETFHAKVFSSPLHRWTGPYRSGFGWHLVRVQDHIPERRMPWAEAREQVRIDLVEARRIARKRQAYAALLARYRLIHSAAAE